MASMLAARVSTVLWARSEDVAGEVETTRTNRAYLGDVALSGKLHATADLAEAVDGASLVVVAIPSHGVRGVLSRLPGGPGPGAAVLSLAKGLEPGTSARVTEVVSSCWPGRPVGVLTGPNLAEEVLAGQPSASVIAMSDEPLARELQDLFATETLRVYTNPDVVGCEIAGVVKNVMAIATGMAAGLGFGDNTRAALITRSLAELARLGVALGGDPLTFSGLAGLGDLVATCTSLRSRNRSVGVALGEGRSLDQILAGTRMIAEGVGSSQPVVALAGRLGVDVPVAEQVVAVCFGGRAPSETIPILMRRSAKSEFEGRTRR